MAFSSHDRAASVWELLSYYRSDLLRFALSLPVLLVFRYCFHKYRWQDLKLLELICLALGFNLISALVISYLVPATVSPVNHWFDVLQRESVSIPRELDEAIVSFVYSFVFQNIWCLIYVLVAHDKIKQRSSVDSLLLNTELLVTRSLALRQQISPHFLFNGLNNICSLVDEDASKAQGLLRNISELLRFNMNVEQAIAVSVEDELHFLEKYISVSELQYENRLRYSQKVDSECMSYFIPVLAIQTLVENAIKHGLNDAPKACRIELDIIDSGTFVEVSVVNDGRIKREGANKIGGPESIAMDNTRCKQKGESGLGLRNLRERIEIFFGSSATLHLDQDGEKVRVILRFPKKRHGRSVASNNLSMMK